jgi:Flp pilus assembly protein TadG
MKTNDASRRAYRNSGQLFPTLALILVGLLAVGALGIDVFTLYWAQSNLQRGTDAAALAGAMYLNNVTFAGANPGHVVKQGWQRRASFTTMGRSLAVRAAPKM